MSKLFVSALMALLVVVSAQAADKKKATKEPARHEKPEPSPPAPDLPKASEENRQFIKSVQDMLVKAGCLQNSEADGRLGGRTKDALKQFQKQNGLGADGRLTPETFELLARKTRN